MSYPQNPILSTRTREGKIESVHRGAWVAVRSDGEIVGGAGDPGQYVYPRSASKSLQVIPLLESGAADAFGFGHPEIALGMASHSGENIHVEVVANMLDAAGLSEDDLQCGPQAPFGSAVGTPGRRIVNNCSGKHAGFLATAVHTGVDPSQYLSLDHGVQKNVVEAVSEMAQTTDFAMGVDGCSAPTFRLPLSALATGVAAVTTPAALGKPRATTCRRITDAAAAEPYLVGGTVDRMDSDIMAATGGRVYAKTGAEGVFVVGIVGGDLGYAIKIDDGEKRGHHHFTVSLLHHLGLIDDEEFARLGSWADSHIRNWDGLVVGEIRPSRDTWKI